MGIAGTSIALVAILVDPGERHIIWRLGAPQCSLPVPAGAKPVRLREFVIGSSVGTALVGARRT
jgi:hypothetical protein